MPSSTGLTAFVLPFALIAAFGVFTMRGAAAQQAVGGDDRCSGTFCDLYYGGPAPEGKPAAPQGAPTPLMVPNGNLLGGLLGGAQPTAPGAAPAKRPLVGVQGGGLLGMARGEPAERCTGTFCDLYYGGPPPEKPAEPAAAAAPPGSNPAPEAAADPDVAPQPAEDTSAREIPERREPPRCAASGGDPWQCYRK